MATTITSGATTITPALILGYDTDNAAQTVRHDIVGLATPSFTIAPDRARTGNLRCFFTSTAAAMAARTFLASKKVFVLASTEIPAIGMTFVRDGGMNLALDETTGTSWILTIGYQEVTP